jgi:hypothetical protein
VFHSFGDALSIDIFFLQVKLPTVDLYFVSKPLD